MRVAIPVWQARVSPVFDTAGRLLIFDLENGHKVSRTEQPIAGLSMRGRVNRLAELNVDELLCGAISRPLAGMIAASGIKVIPWMSGDVEEVVAWYLDGKPLDARFLMPGCGRRRRRFRGPHGSRFGRYTANYPEDIL